MKQSEQTKPSENDIIIDTSTYKYIHASMSFGSNGIALFRTKMVGEKFVCLRYIFTVWSVTVLLVLLQHFYLSILVIISSCNVIQSNIQRSFCTKHKERTVHWILRATIHPFQIEYRPKKVNWPNYRLNQKGFIDHLDFYTGVTLLFV